jgi:hypothetical protein
MMDEREINPYQAPRAEIGPSPGARPAKRRTLIEVLAAWALCSVFSASFAHNLYLYYPYLVGGERRRFLIVLGLCLIPLVVTVVFTVERLSGLWAPRENRP